MKVLVVGASGLTGQIALELLLARGDQVTAFARSASSITAKHERLRVMEGQANDRGSLDRALAGQDAVFCAVGPRRLGKTDVQVSLMRNLVPAMQAAGVKRIVNLSAWGIGPEPAGLVLAIIRATLLKSIFADKRLGEDILLASDLDYVNVRPGRLTNGPVHGGVGASETGKGLAQWLTRRDLTPFMITQLDAPTWVRKSPVVGYGTPR